MGLEQPVPGLVAEAPSSNNYKRAFAPALSVKDLTIGIEAARRVGINPSAGEVALRAFREVDDDPRTHVSFVWFWFWLLGMWPMIDRILIIPRSGCMSMTIWINRQRRIFDKAFFTSSSYTC